MPSHPDREPRRLIPLFIGAILCALPWVGMAGQIYGTVLSNGQPLKAKVVLQCGTASVSKTTDDSGAYRLFLKADGQCSVTINGANVDKPVFLYASPTRYNFYKTDANGRFQRQ